MHFTSFLVAGAFAVLVSAQSASIVSSSVSSVASVSSAASVTPVASVTTTDAAQASEAACLKACSSGDVDCQAKCIAVPSPDAAAANATTECVASCNQGNGTASENQEYADCVQNCINNNYFTSTGTPAQSTDASGSTATGSAATATGTSDSSDASGTSGSSTASGTSSLASASSSSSADGNLKVGMAGVTLFGLIAAVFAL